MLNYSRTCSEGHVHSVRHADRPSVDPHGRTHTNKKPTCTHIYMHTWPRRLSNVMCRDRLSALLSGCSTVKLHSMLGLQHGSIWLVKKSSWKLQMWNFSCWQTSQHFLPLLNHRSRVKEFMHERERDQINEISNYWQWDRRSEEHYTVTYYTFNVACSAHTGKEYFLLLKSSSS